MNLARFALEKRVIVLAAMLVAAVAGLATFTSMPRREDPEILIRTCVVVTRWPGASAEKVENLVTDPLESAIYQINEVDEIRSESRTGQSIIYVDLEETIAEIDQLWDEVRSRVDQAAPRLPEGCGKPLVNSDFGDVYPVVLALYQVPPPGGGAILRPYSDRELEVLAEGIKDELKSIPAVGKVDLFGVQDEVIYLEPDALEWSKVGRSSDELARLLAARNIVAPGGSIHTGTSSYSVIPSGDFAGVRQIDDVLVGMQDGEVPVKLGDMPLALRRGIAEPPVRRVRFHDGSFQAERALLLAVAMKSGRNVVEMGAEVDARVRLLQEKYLPPDVALTRVNDLPRQVSTLVGNFVTNLWQAIVIVLLVALLMMGWRPAVIMASAIPLCMIAAILIVAQMGIELEQFSIASLIIALGMLVDNAIVVSENVLTEIRKGGDRKQAVIRGTWDLVIPLLTSTLTTVAAFLPMVTIQGNTGEYVRSLPIVVAVTLLISFLVAMTLTPILCFYLLKAPAPGAAAAPQESGGGFYERLVRACMARKALTLGGAAAAVAGALFLVPLIGNQFFPGGIRDQFWIHVWSPEGSSLAATQARCEQVERIIQETRRVEVDGELVDRLANVCTLAGNGGPRLNLTTNPEQEFPSYGLLLVNTTDATLSRPWAALIAGRVRDLPGVRVDVKPFNLGPAVPNPVEFRLVGDDAALLRVKAEQMIAIMRATPGAVNPWSNWYNDAPRVDVQVDATAANLAGVTNESVAATLDTLLSGGYLTTYREGDHTVAVRLKARAEQPDELLAALEEVYVDGKDGKVPLGSVADVTPSWGPSVIARKNTRRTVTVGCQVAPGVLPNSLAAELRPQLERMLAELPATYRLEDGGEVEKTVESSAKIMNAFAISAALILLVLVSQYNSILKPFIVLATVPLALVGALLGLFATGWALGFMPSLGIVSLAGVVINNAIILIEVIELNVKNGMALRDAVARAGQARMKPILLTTLTTVAGMIPLALFGGPMWAGMAWAIIFGLALSTVLTLLVIPVLYLFAVERLGVKPA